MCNDFIVTVFMYLLNACLFYLKKTVTSIVGWESRYISLTFIFKFDICSKCQ